MRTNRIDVLFLSAALAATLCAACFAAPAAAEELPALGAAWRDANPYRDRPEALAPGREAFNANCARCHGVDAVASGSGAMPAPDLRRLGGFCRRIGDEALRGTCRNDTDAYFIRSARQGKVIVGVRHMPAWEGALPQETLWQIRTYLEARGAEMKPH